jgi:integral membrane protein
VAVAEAISWAGLLIGMFFKYAMGNAVGVHIFGSVHGVVFIAYVVLSLLARRALSWDNRTTVWALVASIPPFGSVVFERWATRTGRLAERAVAIN